MSENKYLDKAGLVQSFELLKGKFSSLEREDQKLSDRIDAIEGSSNFDVKKETIKLYNSLAALHPELKPQIDELRHTLVGLDDFAKLGTGLFIHWGVYAVPAGNYTGPKQEGSTITATSTNYNTEWIMRDLGIPIDTYKAFGAQFTAENWDPETLCKAAYDAGMGYVVITAKHHDGFILYPSNHGDWDVTNTAARHTILDELKSACDKYGLKFGLYVSQYWDWTAEGGFGLNVASKKGGYWNGSSADMYTSAQHTSYCNRAVEQINEMIEKYNPFLLWYDPGTSYSSTYTNILVKGETDKYPHILTNDRLLYDRSRGDFGTGERTIYLRSLPVSEACFTMNNTWGYSDNNEKASDYYTHEKVFKQFILMSLAYGQNCLMNIGPKADGSIPERQLECLESMKNFFNTYGSFRNYKRYHSTFIPTFGYALELEGNKFVCYILTKGNPASQNVVLDCFPVNGIKSVKILTPGTDASYEIVGDKILINNLALDSDTKVGVVEIDYEKDPEPLAGNLYYANQMVPSRVFVYNSTALQWDASNYWYKLRPSAKALHTTSFIWKGESGNYNLTLNRERIKAIPISEDDITTVVISDESAEQTLTYAYEVSENETAVALVNGLTYTLTLKCVGTESGDLYRLDGYTFSPEIIIIHPESVTLNEHNLFIEEGGTGQLEAVVLPVDATDPSVTWSSSDETVASVDADGTITAIAAGNAVVTVSTVDGAKTDSCNIIVTGRQITHVTSVTLNETSITKVIGQTHQLTQTVLPADATYPQCVWSSSDETVATVDDSGLVTAVGEGNATITCTALYDQISASCEVTVLPIMPNSISLNKSELTLIPGFSETLTVTFNPENTTHKEIYWDIDNEDIATITDGVVFAKAPGTAVITATSISGGKTATCTLTVNAETYNQLFEAESLDGSADQGAEWDIHIFCDECPNWTLFGFVQDSRNTPYEEGGARQTDNNATLYQCVVSSSPWTGLRIDADNNSYPTATTDKSTMYPRFLAGQDHYISPLTGVVTTQKTKFSVNTPMHPVWISRDGDVYKSSIDGVNWTVLEGLTSVQLARLVNEPITIGWDYKRASGQKTTTKYRFLRTDNPVCVALKMESEYPFYTLNNKYYHE